MVVCLGKRHQTRARHDNRPENLRLIANNAEPTVAPVPREAVSIKAAPTRRGFKGISCLVLHDCIIESSGTCFHY